MEPRRSKHFLAHIPTIALLVVFAMSPWLGILFFILRAIDRDAEKKEQENAEYSSDFRPQDTGAGQPTRDTEPVYGHDVPTAEQQNAKKRHKTLTSLCTVFGGIFLVVGLAGLADIIDMWGYWFDWGEFLTALAQTIGGGAALAMGLVDMVFPAEELLDAAVNMAKEMAAKPPLALEYVKWAVNEGMQMDLDRALLFESALFAHLYSTEDQKEAMSAFLEKRPTRPFQGK